MDSVSAAALSMVCSDSASGCEMDSPRTPSRELILSLMSLLNLKDGTTRSSICTISPVRGLRAGLALRGLQAKVPKPRISMVLPSTSFSDTRSRNCSMTILMSLRTNPVDLAIS